MIEERRAFFSRRDGFQRMAEPDGASASPIPLHHLGHGLGGIRMQEWNPALSVTRMPVLPSWCSITGILERGGNTARQRKGKEVFH